jgi:hypothetical protein
MTARGEHRWAVDGIEEGMARVEEDGARMLVIPLHLLPAGTKEGQILRVTRGAATERDSVTLTIAIDDEATAKALARSRETIAGAMAASRKRDPGGDVSL